MTQLPSSPKESVSLAATPDNPPKLSFNEGTKKIIGATSSLEVSVDGGASWFPYDASFLNSLHGGEKILFRVSKDHSSNKIPSKEAELIITDTLAPIISLGIGGGQPIILPAGSVYAFPTASASDNLDGVRPVTVTYTKNGLSCDAISTVNNGVFPVFYQMIFTTSDTTGHTSQVIQQVIVQPNRQGAPSLTLDNETLTVSGNTTNVEYTTNEGISWADYDTEATKLPPGKTVMFRIKGDAAHYLPPSLVTIIDVPKPVKKAVASGGNKPSDGISNSTDSANKHSGGTNTTGGPSTNTNHGGNSNVPSANPLFMLNGQSEMVIGANGTYVDPGIHSIIPSNKQVSPKITYVKNGVSVPSLTTENDTAAAITYVITYSIPTSGPLEQKLTRTVYIEPLPAAAPNLKLSDDKQGVIGWVDGLEWSVDGEKTWKPFTKEESVVLPSNVTFSVRMMGNTKTHLPASHSWINVVNTLALKGSSLIILAPGQNYVEEGTTATNAAMTYDVDGVSVDHFVADNTTTIAKKETITYTVKGVSVTRIVILQAKPGPAPTVVWDTSNKVFTGIDEKTEVSVDGETTWKDVPSTLGSTVKTGDVLHFRTKASEVTYTLASQDIVITVP